MSSNSSKSNDMRILPITTLLAALLCAAFSAGPVAARVATIRLTVAPPALYADGRSVCTVSAEVRSGSGELVVDGSQVRFSSSLGIIDSSATTVAGVARATLKSGTQAGKAMVSAVIPDGAVAQVNIDFLPPGAEMAADAFVRISSGKYLAYAMDTQVVDATGGAKVQHRGLVIQAGDVQLGVGQNSLRARQRTGGDPIRVSRGQKSFTARLLTYDLASQRGVVISDGADGKLVSLSFNGTDLTTAPLDGNLNETAFEFVDLSETRMLVKAKEITIRPRYEVQFRKAEMYIDGTRTFQLPLYLLPLTGDPTRLPEYVGLTSSGLRVDMPFYFALGPGGASAVRIRNQQGGWSRNSSLPSWGVDLEQNYAGGDSEGRFTVGQINRSDWGFDWEHNQRIGLDSRVHTYVGFPAHRDLFGMLNFSRNFTSSTFGLNLRGTRNQNTPATMAGDLYLQSHPRALLSKLFYSVALHSSLTSQVPGYQRSGFGSGVQLQLSSAPLSYGKKIRISNSLSVGQDWGGARSGFSAFGSSMLSAMLSPRSSLALGYTFTLDPAIVGNYGRHRLSLNYMSFTNKWRTSLAGVYTLDQPMASVYGSVGYQFIPMWALNVRGMYQEFASFGFGDIEIDLARQIGNQEVALTWSRSDHKIRVEFSPSSF